MKCIFCKKDSTESKSIEHIIPESLGNKEHTLEKGVVCDQCNHYFSIKIEKTLLESAYFKHIRHHNDIQSKKGKIPSIQGVIGGGVDIIKETSGNISLNISSDKVISGIKSGRIKHMLVPIVESPQLNDKIMSRFLAKVAIEILASRFQDIDDWNSEIVDNKELDCLRNYARFGNNSKFWEYHQRRIYEETDRFFETRYSNEPYEILHEIELKYLCDNSLFLIVVIMGIEYVLNYTNPEITDYIKWLDENNHIVPFEQAEKISQNHYL